MPDEQLDENIDAVTETFTDDEDDAASEYNDTASQYAEMEDALNEANDKYLRLFAEYDNYRKRTAKEKNETYQNAAAKCIEGRCCIGHLLCEVQRQILS